MFLKKYTTVFTLLFLALNSWSQTNLPPTITATGNQFYCPLSQINVALDFNIIDSDNTPIDAIFIQISTGYVQGEDILKYIGVNPNINSSWSSSEGKLTLKLPAAVSVYTDLIAAVKEIVFESNANTISGEKLFSFTIDAANYLPSTGHYYEYISDLGITWDAARIAAEAKTFYGLQGYLATISSAEEAQLSGEQAAGAGWIGGSDAQTEGVWKWVTGPETGKTFWFGNFNGTTNGADIPFAFWNTGEPNQSGNEDYAHITDPTIGIRGSWNDLKIEGDPPGSYHPKGYIVEYGGMPGDPILNISASTKIAVSTISATTEASLCGGGVVSLQANATLGGSVLWFDSSTGGTPLGTGTNFTTPFLTTTTTYYAVASAGGICDSGERIPVTASIYAIPTATTPTNWIVCDDNNDGFYDFDLPLKDNDILNGQDPTIFKVSYFLDAALTQEITGIHTNTIAYTPETIYVRVANKDNLTCANAITNFKIGTNPTPQFDLSIPSLFVCTNDPQLTSTATSVNGDTYNYVWVDDTGTILGHDASLQITKGGKYSVTASFISGSTCTTTKSITITESVTATIVDMTIVDDSENNSIAVNITGTGNYDIALDNLNDFNPFIANSSLPGRTHLFSNVTAGIHKVFIRDKNGCGLTIKDAIVIGFSHFLTPNGDGINDTWNVAGASLLPNSLIYIFDRFGKLIAKVNPTESGWDGTFNGRKLPSNDYWFTARLQDGRIRKGHFSLVRR